MANAAKTKKVKQAPPPDDWLNKPDACTHAAKISPATLARWVERGYITPHRVDGRTMYSRSEIDAFLQGRAAS